jgi:hypothetical protein
METAGLIIATLAFTDAVVFLIALLHPWKPESGETKTE